MFISYFASVVVVDNGNKPVIPDILNSDQSNDNMCIDEADVLYTLNQIKGNLSSGLMAFLLFCSRRLNIVLLNH